MQVWPAIDLRDGKCVRLVQGDYARETVFGDDPAAMARRWIEAGGECLHLVDLDGARDGKLINRAAIQAIRAAVSVPCELGGGIRDEAAIISLLDLGIDRLVIGTQAQKQPVWFRQMCEKYPGRLVLGLDARDGLVATDGWLATSAVGAVDLAREYAKLPLAGIIYTDISRDGLLAGPNLPAMAAMQAAVALPVIASGGVSGPADVTALARAGMAGCIIGRALYDGKLTLADALVAAQG